MSFKTFRNRYQSQGAYGALQEHSSRMSKTLTKLQQDDIRDNEHDLTDLLELRDIEDELSTIRKVFRDQQRVINELIVGCYAGSESHKKGLDLLQEAQKSVNGYSELISEMQDNCRSAQESVSNLSTRPRLISCELMYTQFMRLLDLKQKQASVWEAWAAREANEVASGQSRAVLVFTIFTIIFVRFTLQVEGKVADECVATAILLHVSVWNEHVAVERSADQRAAPRHLPLDVPSVNSRHSVGATGGVQRVGP